MAKWPNEKDNLKWPKLRPNNELQLVGMLSSSSSGPDGLMASKMNEIGQEKIVFYGRPKMAILNQNVTL